MPTNHISFSNQPLLDTSAVLAAGQQLQAMLGTDIETLDYAVTQLEDAATVQDADASKYRAFMFSELADTEETTKEERQRMSEDIFASVLVDVQVANVLISAAEAVGEVAEKKDSQHLADALIELQETTSLISPAGAGRGRLNFSSSVATPPVVDSIDVEAAIEAFKKMSSDTLDKLVEKIREVAVATFSAMKKIAPDKVLEALNQLGGPVGRITEMIGRLFRKGLEKLQKAVDDLAKLVGSDKITEIKDRIVELWNNKGSGVLDTLLAKLLGVQTTRDQIATILVLDGISKDALDQANNDISRLLEPFVNKIEIAKKTIEAVSFATGILVFTPVAGQKLALFAASSYLVILSATVLLAMDYADSGRVLKFVRGVGEISNSLRPAHAAGRER